MKTEKRKIYIINEWSLSDGDYTSVYDNEKEWKKEIDKKANTDKDNTYYKMTVGIYGVSEDSDTEIETGISFDCRGEKHKKVYVNYAHIPEDWKLIGEQTIDYFSIKETENEDGKIMFTDGDEDYDTYEEALDITSPSQYMYIL